MPTLISPFAAMLVAIALGLSAPAQAACPRLHRYVFPHYADAAGRALSYFDTCEPTPRCRLWRQPFQPATEFEYLWNPPKKVGKKEGQREKKKDKETLQGNDTSCPPWALGDMTQGTAPGDSVSAERRWRHHDSLDAWYGKAADDAEHAAWYSFSTSVYLGHLAADLPGKHLTLPLRLRKDDHELSGIRDRYLDVPNAVRLYALAVDAKNEGRDEQRVVRVLLSMALEAASRDRRDQALTPDFCSLHRAIQTAIRKIDTESKPGIDAKPESGWAPKNRDGCPPKP